MFISAGVQKVIAAAFSLVALILAALSLRHARWPHVAAYVASVACIAVGLWFAMGTPRPVWLGHKPGIRVLALAYSEGQWIAVWTQDGTQPPIAWVLPWSERQAAAAQRALRAARRAHGTVRWGKPAHDAGAGHGAPGRGPAGHGAGRSGGGAAPGSGGSSPFLVAPHAALPLKVAP